MLNLDDLDNVKVRFNLSIDDNKNPIDFFKNADFDTLLRAQYWNYSKLKSYKAGQITIGFVKLAQSDQWLLFHVGRITRDLNKLNGIGYEYEVLSEYEKYFGRLIVRYKNESQNMIRRANSIMDQCEVLQILPDTFDNDIFPGYDKVNLLWHEMSRVLSKEGWRTALQNQKGVYMITDQSNGKMYVGSAYGDHMILGRWKSYIKIGHGGNVELKKLSFEYIKVNFKYSILDIFKSTVDDKAILERESWWKMVLQTREFGYNIN